MEKKKKVNLKKLIENKSFSRYGNIKDNNSYDISVYENENSYLLIDSISKAVGELIKEEEPMDAITPSRLYFIDKTLVDSIEVKSNYSVDDILGLLIIIYRSYREYNDSLSVQVDNEGLKKCFKSTIVISTLLSKLMECSDYHTIATVLDNASSELVDSLYEYGDDYCNTLEEDIKSMGIPNNEGFAANYGFDSLEAERAENEKIIKLRKYI